MTVELPDGEVVEFPDHMSEEAIAAVLRSQTRAQSAVGRGALSEWKTRLLQEPPAGHPRQNPVARGIRTAGRFVIPGSYPEAITLATSMLPGAGFLPMLGRVGLATGGSAAVEYLRGGDATGGALHAATQSVGGEVLGAAGRGGMRYVQSRLDPLTRRVAEAVGQAIPVFRGKTPSATLARAMSSEGQKALSHQYGAAVDSAIAKAGDPFVALAPGYVGPASMLHRGLQAEKRRLFTLARDPARVKDVYQRIDDVHALEQNLVAQIEKRLPPQERGVFAKANADYRAGKEIQALFKGAPGRLTATQERQLITPEGQLNPPVLQSNLLLRSGKLQEALGPDRYAALVQAVRHGATDPLARDVPGVAPHVRLHLGFLPTIHGMPHAPRLIGEPEVRADLAARALRGLGTRGTVTLTEDLDAQR